MHASHKYIRVNVSTQKAPFLLCQVSWGCKELSGVAATPKPFIVFLGDWLCVAKAGFQMSHWTGFIHLWGNDEMKSSVVFAAKTLEKPGIQLHRQWKAKPILAAQRGDCLQDTHNFHGRTWRSAG